MNDVLAHIDRDELVALTQALVRIPSVVRPETGGNEEATATFVADWLKAEGFEVTVDVVEPGRPNVIGTLRGRAPGRTLMFEAHTDVVTEGDPGEWTYPPFGGELHDGRVYGRGACDTQGNLAAALVAAKALKRAGTPFNGRVLLGIPVDEEGMMSGIKHFIRQGWADEVDACIVCEPEENQLCIAQKGALRVRVETRGVMSHGAMPLSGFNPIGPMTRIVRRVEQLERDEIERLGQNALLGFPSFTPTVVRAPAAGDAQLNVMPSRCVMLLDVRTVPGQDHEHLKARLGEIVSETEREIRQSLRDGFHAEVREALRLGLSRELDFSAELDVFEERPWTETARDEPIVRAMERAYRVVAGREPVYNGVPGATDGTFLYALKGIPIVTTGAGDRLVPHHKDEWVGIDELVETAKLYALSALEYLNDDT